MQERENSTVIQGLWIGDKLSPMEQLSIRSFLCNNHEYHLYTYKEVLGVPEGTIVKDANDIISENQIFTTHGGSYAQFADWFRWKLLRDEGNYWCDLDVVCLRPFDFEDELVFGWERINHINIAVLKFPKNHKVPIFLESSCRNPLKALPWDGRRKRFKKTIYRLFGKEKYYNSTWGTIGGPSGFTETLKHFNLASYAKPYTCFYPISWLNWDSIFDETFQDDERLFSNTYAIHLWNEVIRREPNFDKDADFPKNSLIEILREKYTAR